MPAGKYIVIEGNDGTGKSTQVELLGKYLNEQGIETFIAHEPAGTPIADEVRTIIKNGELTRDPMTDLLLFTACRREIWLSVKDRLAEGTWVLSARNYISTEAYQGIGDGVDTDLIHKLTQTFTDSIYMKPDNLIVLSLTDESIRAERIAGRGEIEHPDRFESREDKFQHRVNEGYLKIAKKYNLPIVDATRSIEEIQTEIRTLVGL